MSEHDLAETKKKNSKQSKLFTYILLHVLFLLYSVAAICSKNASQQDFFSISFFLWYAGVLVLLGIYALGWQQILKRLPLTTAFANKGVTIIWGFLWGALLFSEVITLKMYIGAAIVFLGVILVAVSNE